jgi:hypothetical protein
MTESQSFAVLVPHDVRDEIVDYVAKCPQSKELNYCESARHVRGFRQFGGFVLVPEAAAP